MIYEIPFPDKEVTYWDYEISGAKLYVLFEHPDDRITQKFVGFVDDGVGRVKTIYERQLVGKSQELIIEI